MKPRSTQTSNEPREEDQRVFLHDVTFDEYEKIAALRGEASVPKITYLDGDLELMSPSTDHEYIKTSLARLLETWSLVSGIGLEGYGSWTLKKKVKKLGIEPDECYLVGRSSKKPKRPDLAIEVVWTSGGLDKLEAYRRFAVPEVWFWKDGRLTIHVLVGEHYREVGKSRLLPGLDLDQLVRFAKRKDQAVAVREYYETQRRRR